jgi:putative hemolysin
MQSHAHMAIVEEADGTVSGLVTFEDIIEELLGEIHDEYDRLPAYVHTAWVIGGRTPMARVRAVARLTGPNGTTADNESLNDWIVSRIASLEPGGRFDAAT